MTPVQIPFKRNFKDMENKFEYLKIDGREQLPAPWSDYPVLREYETVTVYRNGRDYLDEGMTTRNRKASLKERFRIMAKHYGWSSTTIHHAWFVFRAVIHR